MKRILVVDADRQNLDALKERLTGRVIDWEFSFSDSAKAALALINKQSFDVVVTDNRVGKMEGDELLSIVSGRNPAAIRIALDEGVHPQKVFEHSSIAHQYLTKPCDPEQLVKTIKRVSELQDELAILPLVKLVSGIDHLPSVPTLYADIMEELQSRSSSLERVGRIISKDVAMTTKVLQLANSAYYGFTQRITKPTHAVTILGINTITSLALSAGIFAQSAPNDHAPVDVNDLMEHSTLVAFCARDLAVSEGLSTELQDICFLAGFLHDVGKLILAHYLPKQYVEVQALSEDEGMTMVEAEREILGANHAQIGGYLLGLWGLPDLVVEAVLRHHWPSGSRDESFTPLAAVHSSNAFAEAAVPPGSDPDLDSQYLIQIGSYDNVDKWQNIFLQTRESLVPTPEEMDEEQIDEDGGEEDSDGGGTA